MQPPRLIGSTRDTVLDIGSKRKNYVSRKYISAYQLSTSYTRIYAYSTGVWVQGFDYIAVKVDQVWYTTKLYNYRFRTLLDFTDEKVRIITLEELKNLVLKRIVCINNMGYKSLREKRKDLIKFNQYICELPTLTITEAIQL